MAECIQERNPKLRGAQREDSDDDGSQSGMGFLEPEFDKTGSFGFEIVADTAAGGRGECQKNPLARGAGQSGGD